MKRVSAEQEASRLLVGFLRSLRAWTQEEFGKASGADRRTIGRYESGKLHPSRRVLQGLAAAAGVQPARVPQLLALFRQIGDESGEIGETAPSSVHEEIAAEIAAEVSAAIEPEILAALAELSYEVEVDEAGAAN
jgi:transcriptional regulator with XRE-family HTH domain